MQNTSVIATLEDIVAERKCNVTYFTRYLKLAGVGPNTIPLHAGGERMHP